MKKGASILSLVVCCLAFAGGVDAQDVISLEDAIGIAVDQSTFVGTSRQQLQISRQNVLNRWGSFLPNFVVNSYAGRSFIGPTGSIAFDLQGRPVQPTGFDFESYSFSLNSSILLFDWGSNIKSLNSAKRDAEASEYALQYQKDLVTANVIRAYYNLVRDLYLILVEEESVRAAQRNLDQVEAFFAIGSNTKADVLRARVRLGNSQLALISARNNAEVSRATLASQLNYPLHQTFAVDTSFAVTIVAPDLDSEIAYMLEHRSDLLGRQKQVNAASDNVTATQNRRWPTLAASWQYSWNDRQFPDGANFFENEYSWGVGLVLNWNVFDRYQTKSSILNAKAQNRVAEYNLQQQKLDAILEVKTIYHRLKEAEERMRVSEVTENESSENLRLAEERYRVGAGTILETVDAQYVLQQARSDLVRARCDYLIARAELQRATGRPVKVD
jgi:outer membrane protein TolC